MKKFLSALLAVVMIFTILPITSFAASNSIVPSSKTINVGIAKIVTLNLKTSHKSVDYEYSIAYTCESGNIGLTWGSWDGDDASLYITGLKSGTVKIKFYFDDDPSTILSTVTVNVQPEPLTENETNLYVAAIAIKALKNTLYVPSSLKISEISVAKGCHKYDSSIGDFVDCKGNFTGYSVVINYSASSKAGVVSTGIEVYGIHLKGNYTYSLINYHTWAYDGTLVNSSIGSRYNIYGMIANDEDLNIWMVYYNANGGSVSPSGTSVESGKSVTLPTPTRSGYTCLGWSTNKSASSASYKCGASYKPTSNVTLYAVWKANSSTTISAPSSFTVDTRNTTSLKVKWNSVSGSSGYQLQRKKTVNGELKWVDVANTTATTYTIGSLSAGTLYYLRVRSYKTVNGSKQYSSWKTLTTCTKPSTVTGVKTEKRTTTSIKFKWDAVPKASYYEVQRKKTVDGKLVWVSLGTTTAKNFTISDLSAGTLYYIRVRAIRKLDNGNKYYSDWKNITTCTNPSAVKNLKTQSIQKNSVTLKWDKVSKATNYEIQQKKTVNGKVTWVLVNTLTATSYTINSLKSGTTYNFRVRAFRKLDNGNKYFSEWKEISVKTK